MGGIVFFFGFLAVLAVFIGYLTLRKKNEWKPPVVLADFPDSAKMSLTLLLAAYGLVHAMGVGEAYLKSRNDFTSAGEYFYYMSLGKLVATSHAHLFGHGTMYFLTSALFLFSSVSERTKTLLIGLAMSSGLLDVASWWMLKYHGDVWEIFAVLAGILYIFGWGSMAGRMTWEMWRPRG